VAVGLLPDALAFPLARLERYGIPILLTLLILLPLIGDQLGLNLDVLRLVIAYPVNSIVDAIGWLTGLA